MAKKPGAVSTAAPVRRSGKIVIQATIVVPSTLPAGETIKAIATAVVNDATYGGSVGLQADMIRSGNKATVSITLPYQFAVISTATKLVVSLNVVSSFAGIGSPTFKLTQTMTLPANSATTQLVFPGTL